MLDPGGQPLGVTCGLLFPPTVFGQSSPNSERLTVSLIAHPREDFAKANSAPAGVIALRKVLRLSQTPISAKLHKICF